MRQIFDIEMNVPLGIRRGRMLFEEQDGRVNGKIEILGHITSFSGKMDDRTFTIEGTLKTVLRNIGYQGYGKIDGQHILVRLKVKDGVYEVIGHLRETEKEKEG